MKRILALIILAISTSATAQQQKNVDPYTDPLAAIEHRKMMHRLMQANMQDMIAMATGEKQFDGFKMLIRAEQIDYLSQGYLDFFLVSGSIDAEGSNTSKSVADNLQDFKYKIFDLKTAARGLSNAMRHKDPKTGPIALGKVAESCQVCHAEYMKQPK